MPENACLHIQARDADPLRVVALPGISVRIGRASYCEVRLPEPEVAEEACHLERRGRTWHLVPVGRPGAVRIGGQAVEHSRPLPFGVPFRVGDHRLTLQPSGDVDARSGWGSFERPIPLDLPAVGAPSREREPVAAPATPLGPDGEDDRLTRWKARQEQRASWLRTRQEERRWEERWKAAGERLRAGAAAIPTAPSATATRPPVPAEPGPSRRPAPPTVAPPPRHPDVRVRAFPRTPAPAQPAPFVAREVPTVPPPLPVAPASLVTVSPSPSVRAPLAPSGWGQTPVPKHPDLKTAPAPIPRQPIAPQLAPAAPQEEPPRVDPVEADPLPLPLAHEGGEGAGESEAIETIPPSDTDLDAASGGQAHALETPEPLPSTQGLEDSTPATPAESGISSGPIPQWLDDGPFVADTNLGRTEGWAETGLFTCATATPATESAPIDEPVETAPPSPIRPALRRPRRASPRTTAPRSRPAHEPGPPPIAAASAAVPTSLEAPPPGPPPHDRQVRLPTAREILDAQRAARAAGTSTRPATGRRAGAEPLPTVCQEPARWTVPLWLGWPPAMALALVLGVVAIALSWSWSIEAEHAGLIANRLARGGPKVDPLPEWATPPDLRWWKTTPGHLELWALERDRTANDPATVAEVRDLLGAASQASPLQACVRFAMARQGQDPAPASSLALSRDVVALAWTGHQLLATGKKEAALKAYRGALEMAAQADLARLAPPAFDEDSQIRRYAMPAEDLIGPIVGDMADHAGWTYAEWSAAVPPFAVARLAAARALRARSSPDATAALDALLDRADAPPPEGATGAVHVAAQAEALALKGRWDEAGRRYRQAIDLMPDPTIRRSWWMNLAEIALRLNDESNRQKALEAAKGNDPNDEITRRAVELLKYYGVRTERIAPGGAQEMTANGLP